MDMVVVAPMKMVMTWGSPGGPRLTIWRDEAHVVLDLRRVMHEDSPQLVFLTLCTLEVLNIYCGASLQHIGTFLSVFLYILLHLKSF